ncbi:hypothetical protein FOA43_003510 [Brettanomyces nanus]|uniref:Histone-binding protein RBBP4-like N-terminal domain-containing protein n=1 Tax=Eeniella nana TaxID=13502 RepID=A0A875SB11_EENNA|nr:uncharacterized protein FOA43_003510 [Brettanomyces nanus]QPG76124.1 hypothetical protein FOA43_003510 [Brettanomyces nanus]
MPINLDLTQNDNVPSKSDIILQPFASSPLEVLEDTDTDDSSPAIDDEIQLKYKIWKKNTPLLYDYIQTSTLLWPSMSVEWFPDVESHGNVNIQRLLLGSYSNGYNSFENLQLCTIKVPKSVEGLTLKDCEFDSDKHEFTTSNYPIANNDGNCKGALHMVQQIPHQGDINKARLMPQNPDLLATISNNGSVNVFDRTKKPNGCDSRELSKSRKVFDDEEEESTCLSDIKLQFHTGDGWGLDWNKFKEGELVTGASDGSIALWDIRDGFKKPQRSSNAVTATSHRKFKTCILSPISTLFCHDYGVNTVQYVWFHDSLIGTAGEDHKFKMFDTRSLDGNPVIQITLQHPINTLDFNKQDQYGLVLGDDKGNLLIEDIRYPERPQIVISNAHSDSITAVAWNHEYGNILGSSSTDGLVKLWKFGSGESSTIEHKLIFTHGGHMLGVSDIAWNPNDPKMLASCSDDNSVHVWKPSQAVF